jgi:hypothetical protein
MTKPLLRKTEQDFVAWFNTQDEKMKFDLATNSFADNTELAKFRRQYVKLLNQRNLKALKV